MYKLAFVFPGQGSQAVGMGRDFYENFPAARAVFQEVDEALGENLTKLIFEGPLETLTLTPYTQPALMAVSLAILAALRSEMGTDPLQKVSFVAGHSLGEYSALAAAGALDVSQTAKLLRIRGNAMQNADTAGGMAALMGGTLTQAEDLVHGERRGGVCVVANDNAPDQQVVSGHKTVIERICEKASLGGFKRAVVLPVSAAFHSPLMAPATVAMREALSAASFKELLCPLIANVTAAPSVNTQEARQNLITQVEGRVRWRESLIRFQEEGVTHLVEIGSGKVLCGLARRTTPSLLTCSLNAVSDINSFFQEVYQKCFL